MSTEQKDEILHFLTKPLSEDELKKYKDFMASENFQYMVRLYHAQTALNSLRQVLHFFLKNEKYAFESIFVAVINLWLQQVHLIEPSFDKTAIESWSRQPVLLSHILSQFALNTLQEHEALLESNYPPELEEMYEEWEEFLPVEAFDPRESDKISLSEVEEVSKILLNLQHELETTPDIKTERADYLEIWTQLLLQLHFFAVEDEAELYFMLIKNWALFSKTLPILVNLMILLQGYEELLLPDNQDKFNNLMQDPEVQQALLQRLQNIIPAKQDP
ncbi:MAG: hypothetical protein IGS03_06165 [Candidatus Sericytochromatia bacterium]|nr:hypothetical protein [Candidatus Sericytochromatia bacterium]